MQTEGEVAAVVALTDPAWHSKQYLARVTLLSRVGMIRAGEFHAKLRTSASGEASQAGAFETLQLL